MTECLVTKAMEECKCEWCNLHREYLKFAVKSYVELEAYRLFQRVMEEKSK